MTVNAADFFADGIFSKKHIVVTGHYGTGKTNIAVNLALKLAEKEPVCLVDCDIVNPYFRSTDSKELLESKGILVFSPNFANTNLDTPSLPAAINSVFQMNRRIIWDVGGDDAGAVVLGMFASRLSEQGYCMLYVINKFRPLTETSLDMEEYLRDIEANSRLKASAIVNNSNLSYMTDADVVARGEECAAELSAKTGLPVAFTCVEEGKDLHPEGKFLPISIHTKTI